MVREKTRSGVLDERIIETLESRPEWITSRVLARLEGYPVPDRCWIWTGSKTSGYGKVALSGHQQATVRTHRAVWIWLNGPIRPSSLVLDHDGPHGCGNRACANPAHLQAVTQWHNIVVTGGGASASNYALTHCQRGHELDNSKAVRRCDECMRQAAHEQRSAIKAAARSLGMTMRAYGEHYGWSRTAALAAAREAGLL